MKNLIIIVLSVFAITLGSCNFSESNNGLSIKKGEYRKQMSPDFNPDSAYKYVEEQLAFGTRVPNSAGHDSCAVYLSRKMRSYNAEVFVQETNIEAFDGTVLRVKNIISSFQPNKKNRVLLFAHYDTRPFADMCSDSTRRNEPILGANDGAGPVAILLEIARIISENEPKSGVDIIFFDAEDYGEPNSNRMETWCLGSTYWSKNLHKKGYTANFGILLDMASGKNAVFTRESHSMRYASSVVDNVWFVAEQLGFQDIFTLKKTHFVGIDDHVPVNVNVGIPSINIIQYNEKRNSFADFWHTHDDNISEISKETMNVVGQTVLEVVYRFEGKITDLQ